MVYDQSLFTTYTHYIIGGSHYIKLAAGGRLEPFWNIFKDHISDENTTKLLERYKIGILSKNDELITHIDDNCSNDNIFSNEPVRMNSLLPARKYPFSAETSSNLLTESMETPNEHFYVRNHFPVPNETALEHNLEILISSMFKLNWFV